MSIRDEVQELVREDVVAKAILGLMSALEQVDSPIKVRRIEFEVPARPKPAAVLVGEVFGVEVRAIEGRA